ncbi:MAG: SH3 domain-containing protein [Leptospiraceae bacterium]|nr:SH3 domain-containing protein [Leptospiraceae bacterium]
MNPLRRTIFLISVTLSLNFSVTAKPIVFYKPGDHLYVLAKSGLNLRDKPSKNGRFLQIIPFGSSTLVRQITDKEYQVDGIYGFWVKVIADDREGYLFDGYLSSYPPPIAEVSSKSIPTLKQYAEKFLPKGVKVTESTDDTLVTTSTLILPLARLEEAYILGVCFFYNFDKYKFPLKSGKVTYPDIEVEYKVVRDKSGQIKSVSVTETYLASGGMVTLVVTDLGNLGVEIKTILSAP